VKDAIAGIYGIGVFIATLYFNWRYATEHGFWAWLFFGEVVATIKGFVWPIYLFM
jgi:hypothetical protein